ncbi:MAG: YceI family protein [Solirubrobacteraceae bacterium]
MPIATGSHRLSPGNASLIVKTLREGVAARAGHDLVLEAGDWEATITGASDPAQTVVELTVAPGSLEVREALHGLKPLSDKDRADIRRTIGEKVLGTEPITFRSRAVAPTADGLDVTGDLTIAGETRAITVPVRVGADGQADATISLTQSDWGIKPYRGLMGALKVRDAVEVVCAGRLS